MDNTKSAFSLDIMDDEVNSQSDLIEPVELNDDLISSKLNFMTSH